MSETKLTWNYLGLSNNNPERLVESINWAFSMLSDVQALIELGCTDEADEKINAVKRVLKGKYEVLEDGHSIRVIRKEEVKVE